MNLTIDDFKSLLVELYIFRKQVSALQARIMELENQSNPRPREVETMPPGAAADPVTMGARHSTGLQPIAGSRNSE